MAPIIVFGECIGELGNQLSHYLRVVQFAKELRCHALYLGFYRYAKFFAGTSQDLFCVFPAQSDWREDESGKLLQRIFNSYLGDMAAAERIEKCDRQLAQDLMQLGTFDKQLQSGDPIAFKHSRTFYYVLCQMLDEANLNIQGLLRAVQNNPGAEGRVHAGHRSGISPVTFEQLKEAVDAGAEIVVIGQWEVAFPAAYDPQVLTAFKKKFMPHGEEAARVNAQATALRKEADVLVGVHFRGGDFRTWESGRHFIPVEAYAKRIAELKQRFASKKVRFIVCSNENDICEQLRDPACVNGIGTISGDFYSLQCSDVILGNRASTFSEMAALLGGLELIDAGQSPLI